MFLSKMVKINVKIETLKKDLEALGKQDIEKIPEFSLSQISLILEKEEKEKPKEKEEVIEKEKKISPLIIIGPILGIVLILGGIFLSLKSKPKIEVSQSVQQKQTQKETTPTTSQITLPVETSLPEETKEPEKIEESFLVPSQKEVEIALQEITNQTIKEALITEKIKKEEPFTFKKIKFTFAKEKISLGHLFQKIFNPQVENQLSLKGFLDNFQDYDLGIYYSPTREYFVIFSKIKNDSVVRTFLDYWLKPNPKNNNLDFIFLGESGGANKGKYETKKIENFDLVNIPYERPGYGFNILIGKNHLAIFPHDSVLEFILNVLKKLE